MPGGFRKLRRLTIEPKNSKGLAEISSQVGTFLALKSLQRLLPAMKKEELDAILTAMIETGEGVSDLVFVIGKPPQVERYGRLIPLEMDGPDSLLQATHIEEMAALLIGENKRLLSDFDERGSCDASYGIGDLARFRVNIYKQNGRRAIVMRKLESKVPTLDELGFPPIFKQIIQEKTGIVVVTGGTGSGKTTTLAAMLNEVNHTQEVHIVTLEDPIEFLHSHGKATFSQREMGKDFPNFASGLRAALRQAPKVIFVGEIRDRDTMEIALTASETGHLVFSTLHTIDAGQTIGRILGMFTKDEEKQVRQRLAETLRYIISQRLVGKIGGGRLLVTEIMGSSLRTRESLIYGEGENRTFQEIIEAGGINGWHSFDQSLLKAYEADLITDETALNFSTHKTKMRRDLEMSKKLRFDYETESSGLQMLRTH
ncbi:MAG: twitching motility protein PilT [Verrucomicrobiota bacterium]|jgi:twitching motility protein PilT